MYGFINRKLCILWATIGATLFSALVFIYIKKADYTQSWLLYVGSFLFFFAIGIHTVIVSKRKGAGDSITSLVTVSYVTTFIGILLSVLFSIALLVFIGPPFLTHSSGNSLINVPPASVDNGNDGMVFNILMAAVVINFSGGSLVSIMIPFYVKSVKKLRSFSNWQKHILNKHISITVKK